MDGLLIVDKPAGPTSHEVVARVRRALGERRIGHTGTLDPAATGVLPLVLGRATRLARFLSASDKSYEAIVGLGVATDTRDAEGTRVGVSYLGPWPSRETIDRALDAFRGTFLQQPPAYSAKKIDGKRSHCLAREASRQLFSTGAGAPRLRSSETSTSYGGRTDADAPPVASHGHRRRMAAGASVFADRPAPPALPAPVSVTAHAINVVSIEGNRVTLSMDCSAGFYVRSLAHDLGERLGTGAHLLALRRTRSGDLTLDHALRLDAIESNPTCGVSAMIPLSRMLPGLSSVTLTSEGVRHAIHGRDLGPGDTEREVRPPYPFFVRLVDPTGELVGIGTPAAVSGLLHPAVVLV